MGVTIKVTDNTDKVKKEMAEKIPLILEAIGAEAATYAMKDAPVDTGRLRNSITWATRDNHGEASASPAKPEDSTPKSTPEEKAVYVGTNVEYAAMQEFGDYNHTVGKKHFLRDAIATHIDHYKAVIKAGLES